jgi:hypothetical protein
MAYKSILENIQNSSVALEHLILKNGQSYSHLVTALVAHLPHIRSLRLLDSAVVDDGIREAGCKMLSRMACLENFEWSGSFAEKDVTTFWEVCSIFFRDHPLRRVVFGDQSHRVVWHRKDQDSEWKNTTYISCGEFDE